QSVLLREGLLKPLDERGERRRAVWLLRLARASAPHRSLGPRLPRRKNRVAAVRQGVDAPHGSPFCSAGKRVGDAAFDCLEWDSQSAPLLEQTEILRRKKKRCPTPADEGSLCPLVVLPIRLGFAHG